MGVTSPLPGTSTKLDFPLFSIRYTVNFLKFIIEKQIFFSSKNQCLFLIDWRFDHFSCSHPHAVFYSLPCSTQIPELSVWRQIWSHCTAAQKPLEILQSFLQGLALLTKETPCLATTPCILFPNLLFPDTPSITKGLRSFPLQASNSSCSVGEMEASLPPVTLFTCFVGVSPTHSQLSLGCLFTLFCIQEIQDYFFLRPVLLQPSIPQSTTNIKMSDCNIGGLTIEFVKLLQRCC